MAKSWVELRTFSPLTAAFFPASALVKDVQASRAESPGSQGTSFGPYFKTTLLSVALGAQRSAGKLCFRSPCLFSRTWNKCLLAFISVRECSLGTSSLRLKMGKRRCRKKVNSPFYPLSHWLNKQFSPFSAQVRMLSFPGSGEWRHGSLGGLGGWPYMWRPCSSSADCSGLRVLWVKFV